MTQTNATTGKPTTRRGFAGLPCPKCGEQDSTTLHLAELTDSASFRCQECEAEWGAEDVRDLIDRWQKVLAWAETAPAIED